jgi:hypothetical protein
MRIELQYPYSPVLCIVTCRWDIGADPTAYFPMCPSHLQWAPVSRHEASFLWPVFPAGQASTSTSGKCCYQKLQQFTRVPRVNRLASNLTLGPLIPLFLNLPPSPGRLSQRSPVLSQTLVEIRACMRAELDTVSFSCPAFPHSHIPAQTLIPYLSTTLVLDPSPSATLSPWMLLMSNFGEIVVLERYLAKKLLIPQGKYRH